MTPIKDAIMAVGMKDCRYRDPARDTVMTTGMKDCDEPGSADSPSPGKYEASC